MEVQEGATGMFGRGLKAFSETNGSAGWVRGSSNTRCTQGMAESVWGPEFPLVAGINRSDKATWTSPSWKEPDALLGTTDWPRISG